MVGGPLSKRGGRQLKAQLKALFEEKARPLAFKCQGEKCSSYFFQRVKAVRTKRVIAGLRGRDGRVYSGTEEMLGIASSFYSALFGEREIDRGASEHFLEMVEERVPEGVRAVLEVPFSLEELGKALAGMKGGEGPGEGRAPQGVLLHLLGAGGPRLSGRGGGDF